MLRISVISLPIAALLLPAVAGAAKSVTLANDSVALTWRNSPAGWQLASVEAGGVAAAPLPGLHSVLFSANQPSREPLAPADFGGEDGFPESQYRYVIPSWREATTPVALNRAGEELAYFPKTIRKTAPDALSMEYVGNGFSIVETWRLCGGSDVCVTLSLRADKNGWYSIATPSLTALRPEDVDFALIPGVLHGHELNGDFSRAYAYGWGIPALPVLFRERSTSTLTSMVTSKNGLTVAVTAEPGTAAEPWGVDKRNTGVWCLGLSAMNRRGEITPTLYHPVLGEEDSYMKAGEERGFSIRYTITKSDWWPVFNHVVNDIYRFDDALALRTNKRSLTDRLYGIHRYVVNDSTSKWHTVLFEGDTIGAQEYLGGVYLAKKDAMKNADYGAMWMLGALTGDSLLTAKRLPYALNFKLRQQHAADGFMRGASRGQYYLRNLGRFVEEWGPYTEPIATTYYMLMDLGNISLFEPDNAEVRERVREAADCLLRWQDADGSWAVAYDDATGRKAFEDLKDYRPTFYGLLIAYRILGDEKYLAAARRGADWLIENAVGPDKWLGVCGDTRFAADFATAQAAEALMELADITGERRYLEAAVRTARFYTTSVYTNPIASERDVTVKGVPRKQWEITTSGLSYEHGGIIGSANLHGPILLASHAGMFVRMFRLTGDRIFLDMARAAAVGRDAFVDDETAVASYYWNAMNRGAGPYPHHAWWQMGWITDYLLAELEARSDGKISFPAGFITPKVGPHRTFGFAPGKVYGEEARLVMIPGFAKSDNPNVEVLLAETDAEIILMLMNDLGASQSASITINSGDTRKVSLPPYGLQTIKVKKN